MTALAYREFVRHGDPDWEDYLHRIANVESRAGIAVVFVAAEGERILGSATLELAERIESDDPPLPADEAQIRMLGVHPDARRRGVARMSIDACFERARAMGKTRMTPHTTHRMKVARTMYERMGFRRLPRPRVPRRVRAPHLRARDRLRLSRRCPSGRPRRT